MASVFKPAGKSKYVIFYTDENGHRRKKTAATDKAVSERIARDIENRVALVKEGIVDVAAKAYRDHKARPLADHISSGRPILSTRGHTIEHTEHTTDRVQAIGNRASRLVAIGFRPEAPSTERTSPDDREARLPRSTRHDCQL